jgi:hypothetical protein
MYVEKNSGKNSFLVLFVPHLEGIVVKFNSLSGEAPGSADHSPHINGTVSKAFLDLIFKINDALHLGALGHTL